MGVSDATDLKITASPENVVDHTQNVTLKLTGVESFPSNGNAFEWKCSKSNNDLLTTVSFVLICSSLCYFFIVNYESAGTFRHTRNIQLSFLNSRCIIYMDTGKPA